MQNEEILEMCCIAVWIHLTVSELCSLEVVKMVNLYFVGFSKPNTQKKILSPTQAGASNERVT